MGSIRPESGQRVPLAHPSFKLQEVLLNNIEAIARAEARVPGQLADEILAAGLRARMFQDGIFIYGGPNMPLRFEYTLQDLRLLEKLLKTRHKVCKD